MFVGVYWQSYGWIAPDESMSGIDDEWRLSGGLPRLIYVKEPAPEREPELEEMLDRIRSDGGVSYKEFRSSGELAELLVDDLALLLSERFGSLSATRPRNGVSTRLPVGTGGQPGGDGCRRDCQGNAGSGVARARDGEYQDRLAHWERPDPGERIRRG